MHQDIKALYEQLAKALGADTVPADDNGIVQLDVGEATSVLLIPEGGASLVLLSPVCELPTQLDRGRVQWLLQRNFHDSTLNPLRVACDAAGSVTIWGRVPVAGLGGEALAAALDAISREADLIREELQIDDTDDDEEDA